jgi:hypothetical protein
LKKKAIAANEPLIQHNVEQRLEEDKNVVDLVKDPALPLTHI